MLERIDGWEIEDLGEFVEGGVRFFEELRVGEVVGVEFIAVVFVNPMCELFVELIGEDNAGVDGALLWFGECDAESEARGPAAVVHGFAYIDEVDACDGVVVFEKLIAELLYGGDLFTFCGRDEEHVAIRLRDDL